MSPPRNSKDDAEFWRLVRLYAFAMDDKRSKQRDQAIADAAKALRKHFEAMLQRASERGRASERQLILHNARYLAATCGTEYGSHALNKLADELEREKVAQGIEERAMAQAESADDDERSG